MDSFLKKFFPNVFRKMKRAHTNDYRKFDNQLLTRFTSSLYIAGLIASFFAPATTTLMGRRPSIFLGGLFFLSGAAINAVAVNVAMLIIEKGWRNRTPDQSLVFDPPGKFQVMRIRYKDADTYMSEQWKSRIAHVCGLSSRWFKWKGEGVADDMQSAMENVGALVIEAATVSQLMDAKEH